jgi:hypothetical protein
MLADLMTPVIKAFFTDMGFEAANMAMQCYGGHGYIRDNGVEQFVRDGRINQTYEGANGVQAMDLVGRKLGRKGGAAPMALFGLISGWLEENAKDDKLAPLKPVKRGLDTLQQATLWLAQNGIANPNNAGAGAVDYLRMMGIVVVGWMWARMAKLAQAKARGRRRQQGTLRRQARLRALLDGTHDAGMSDAAGAHPGGRRHDHGHKQLRAGSGVMRIRQSRFSTPPFPDRS